MHVLRAFGEFPSLTLTTAQIQSFTKIERFTMADKFVAPTAFTFAANPMPKNPDKEKIKELEEEVVRLRKRADEANIQQGVDNLRKIANNYRIDYENTLADKEAYEETINKLSRQNERLEGAKEKLLLASNKHLDRNDKLKEQRNRLFLAAFAEMATLAAAEETIETLRGQKERLETALESARKDLDYADDSNKTVQRELDTETEEHEKTKAELKQAKIANLEAENAITDLNKQLGELNTRAEHDKTTITGLHETVKKRTEDLATAKESLQQEARRAQGITSESAGISKLLTSKQEECIELIKERDDLKAKEATREQTEKDLKEARDQLAAINDQVTKLTIESMERKSFNTDPTAYATPNTVAGEAKVVKRSLEDELVGTGSSDELRSEGSSERSHSEEGSEDEEDGTSPSPEPVGEDDTVTIGEKEPVHVTPVIKTEIQTVFKEITVYTPFEISTHSPLICWIQAELNFLILFSIWLTPFFALLRQTIGHRRSLPPDDFDIPLPDDVAGASQNPIRFATVQSEMERRIAEANQPIPPLEQESDNREASGDPIPPVHPPNIPTVLVQGIGGRNDATPRPEAFAYPAASLRPWYKKIISPRKADRPSVGKTAAGILFHLVVYASIATIGAAYYERQLWLDANDHSRMFLLQLIHNPHAYQSLIHRMAAPVLPESWQHTLDVFIFKYFVEKLGLQAAYALPG